MATSGTGGQAMKIPAAIGWMVLGVLLAPVLVLHWVGKRIGAGWGKVAADVLASVTKR